MSLNVLPRPAAAKSFIGPGAAAMTTQPAANSYTQSPQKVMRVAAGHALTNPWIRAAEKVISGKFSTVEWHLEDENDVEIDDEYGNPKYQSPRELMEHPQANLSPEDRQVNASTRRELWAITSRHMGVCGNAFWYLDQLEPVAKTPLAILYVAPWRMHPSFTKAGQLTGWVLDYDPDTGAGTPLSLDQVIEFNLEPPNEGAFAAGLVQSSLGLIQLDASTVGHAQNVLTAGGRLAGIVSPKTVEGSLPDDKFAQLVRDFRTINEMPDAARRTNILQGPIDFNRTAATLSELELIPLMNATRDDILALWGVPFSQLGGSAGGNGLNSGDIRKYDEAALWQNAIHQRLVPFQEKVQYLLLDRYKTLGITVELEIEEPEFDDDGPRFELLAKSAGITMKNVERRALINLEPLGLDVIGQSGKPLDEEVWIPNTLTEVGSGPPDIAPVNPAELGQSGTNVVVDPNMPNVTAPPAPPMAARMPMPAGMKMPMGKAALPPKAAQLHATLTKLRARLDREHTEPLKASLARFLEAQRIDIAARLRTNPEVEKTKGKDTRAYFAPTRWDRELTAILERPLTAMAQNVGEHIGKAMPVKSMPVSAVDHALARGAARVTKINQRTRDAVQAFVVKGISDGQSPSELADAIETGVLLDNGLAAFDALRAETIARTEITSAYNAAALSSYSDLGATEVQAIDGDGDEECAARDGQVFSIEEADAIEDHPNGTLDWVPVIEDVPVEGKARDPLSVTINNPGPLVRTVLDFDADGNITGSHQVAL